MYEIQKFNTRSLSQLLVSREQDMDSERISDLLKDIKLVMAK